MDGRFQATIDCLIKEANSIILSTPLAQVFPMVEKAYNLAETYAYDTGRLQAASLMAQYYILRGNFDIAYKYSREALALCNTLHGNSKYARIAWLHGRACFNLNRLEEAEDIFSSGIEYATRYQDKVSEALLLSESFFILQKKDKRADAYRILRKSEELFKGHTESSEYGYILEAFASYYHWTEDKELHRDYAKRALKIYGQYKNCFSEIITKVDLYLNSDAHTRVRDINNLVLLQEKAHKYGYFELEFIASLFLGEDYQDTGNLNKALESFNHAIALKKEYGLSITSSFLYKKSAAIYRKTGNFDQAISYLRRGIIESKVEGNEIEETQILFLLSYVLLQLDEVEEAESVYKQAIVLTERLNHLPSKYYASVYQGKIYIKKKQFGNAEAELLQSLDIAHKLGSDSLLELSVLSLSEFYLETRQGKKAAHYYEKLLLLSRQSRQKTLEISALAGLANLSKDQDLSKAIEYLLKVYELAFEADLQLDLMEISKSLSELFVKKGDAEEAFRYFKIYHDIQNSIHNGSTASELKKIRDLFSVVPLENTLQNEKEKVKALEHELDKRSKELALLSLQLSQQDKIFHVLRSRLARIKDHNADNGEIREALKILNTGMTKNGNWKSFQDYFMSIHPHFTQKLLARHSNLTPTEIKICSLLRVSMNSKEISEILNVSTNNVEIHRVHIRKKLGLAKNESLTAFLGLV